MDPEPVDEVKATSATSIAVGALVLAIIAVSLAGTALALAIMAVHGQ